ncbi:phosphatidylglycerol lysyltransferase domain-containing protein [Caulobacter vibrioides]|uniref:Oxacillin resistance-associated protein fmtC n=2 Tax=Caulobacter vibrioides TaxID=155892 RepID=A0A0H3C9V2_CAUVN|nr:bifunctional lysylphosphatidylglycerol flippase/synthetase MprF [Caulobacter vibrioides]YP_002517500.1 bifunctional lysylphosphatidylglycerol flippase/synthetase MprF [Caulobacter vibrioides NA1000]QBQ57211.1 bifunctional lysylphosphatidylglycerol flippase/synthetase MprF [synthetic Caulobacter sp. 'ethensis']ACL95592.1 bifunctional lysylphosphatidylglycerol flippase/synthetase MprF [Caulobacter vibrioides NA1000]ATC28917.1 oxacillin resistance protein FmtC [Caulobacter vibrioides]QXZ50430.
MSSTVFRPAAHAIAPTVAAILAASAGVMLLASGATPSEPTRFLLLLAFAPDLLIEISHFFSSILGLVLLLLAFGLRARLGAAWWAALIVLGASAVLAIFKGLNWEETAMLLVCFFVILPFHDAFPRKAALTKMEITPGWLLSAAAAIVGASVLGWWSFNHTEFADKSWIRILQDHDEAARAIRSSVAAAIVLLGVGVWRLIATAATPPVVDDTDPEFDRVRAILAKAEGAEPSANLALLGDKRFLFSASGETFLMFGVRGRSWIALGPPVGKREERMELFWRFRELADAHAARAGFYGLGPDDLPDTVDLGLAIQKTGESAAVPLEAFSLVGRRREVLRRNWRKAGEGGAAFEVLPVGAAPTMMDELKSISDSWLSHHAGGEKSFSMGGFDPRYVAEFPVAVVRSEGKIVAFATLWTTAAKTAFSMDLMRYSDEAPKNVMDYLFVELLQWGKDEGYSAFEFGVAPLAGLQDRPLAPIMSRVGRLLYERGEEIYNFQGVRRYKDKYDPVWQPRYIAAPQKWAIPFLLADIGLLSSGGVSGLAKRPKKLPEKAAT